MTVIATNVRCQFVPQGWQETQDQTVDSQSESAGEAIFAPSADIKPGDVVTLTDGRKFTIGSRGGLQTDSLGHPHHVEYEVSQ